jgi:hypothetical protein
MSSPPAPVDKAEGLPSALSIDTRRLKDQSIGDQFKCPVCTCLVEGVPWGVSGCAHVCCEPCSEGWKLQTKQGDATGCPLCKHSQTWVPNHAIKLLLEAQKVRCEHDQCPTTYVLGKDYCNEVNHRLVCKYTLLECPDCKLKDVRRLDMEVHRTMQCPERKKQCVHCDEQVRHSEQKQHEKKSEAGACQGLVFCPNKCKKWSSLPTKKQRREAKAEAEEEDDESSSSVLVIKRSEVDKHRLECALEEMACRHPGCTKRYQRMREKAHFRDAIVEHSLALAATVGPHAAALDTATAERLLEMGDYQLMDAQDVDIKWVALQQSQRWDCTVETDPSIFSLKFSNLGLTEPNNGKMRMEISMIKEGLRPRPRVIDMILVIHPLTKNEQGVFDRLKPHPTLGVSYRFVTAMDNDKRTVDLYSLRSLEHELSILHPLNTYGEPGPDTFYCFRVETWLRG